jgi:hypothetical protein
MEEEEEEEKTKILVICYDMIHLLTATGLTHGGSSTVHIYTQTIHRTTQWNRIHRANIIIKYEYIT